jgi:hypothetical protein
MGGMCEGTDANFELSKRFNGLMFFTFTSYRFVIKSYGIKHITPSTIQRAFRKAFQSLFTAH